MNALLEKLGMLGTVGIGLFVFSLMYVFGAVLPQREALAELQAQETKFANRLPLTPAAADGVAEANSDELTRFYSLFPEVAQLPLRLQQIYAVAQRRAVTLEEGEYKLVRERGTRLARYQIVFPIRGSYAEVRAFVADVLQTMPVLALDDLTLRREGITDEVLEARVRFTLFLRDA